MKTSSKFLTGLLVLVLSNTVVHADNETRDDQNNLSLHSSIHLSGDATKADEKNAAKLSISDATSIAKSAGEGIVTKIKLENENGNLVYIAEMSKANGSTMNLYIDAGDGNVLAKKAEKMEASDDNENSEEAESSEKGESHDKGESGEKGE